MSSSFLSSWSWSNYLPPIPAYYHQTNSYRIIEGDTAPLLQEFPPSPAATATSTTPMFDPLNAIEQLRPVMVSDDILRSDFQVSATLDILRLQPNEFNAVVKKFQALSHDGFISFEKAVDILQALEQVRPPSGGGSGSSSSGNGGYKGTEPQEIEVAVGDMAWEREREQDMDLEEVENENNVKEVLLQQQEQEQEQEQEKRQQNLQDELKAFFSISADEITFSQFLRWQAGYEQ